MNLSHAWPHVQHVQRRNKTVTEWKECCKLNLFIYYGKFTLLRFCGNTVSPDLPKMSVPSFYFLLACVLALLFRKCVLGHTVPQSALWNATQSSDTSPRLSVLPPWDPIPNMLKVQLSTSLSRNIKLETNRGLKVLCVSQTVKCVRQLHWEVKIWKLRGLFSILCETLQYLLLP